MLCAWHRAHNVLFIFFYHAARNWLNILRVRLSSTIKGFWYWHVISDLDKPHLNTVHLPGSDMVPLVLGTSHHLSGYLRPPAAQLMDKCVNMRSIWAERPHKPHLIPFWALKYQSVSQCALQIQMYGVVNDGSKWAQIFLFESLFVQSPTYIRTAMTNRERLQKLATVLVEKLTLMNRKENIFIS